MSNNNEKSPEYDQSHSNSLISAKFIVLAERIRLALEKAENKNLNGIKK